MKSKNGTLKQQFLDILEELRRDIYDSNNDFLPNRPHHQQQNHYDDHNLYQGLDEDSYKHFVNRGLEVFTFESYPQFKRFFPYGIPISVSNHYLDKMIVPDQNSSFLMAKASPSQNHNMKNRKVGKASSSKYIFNIPGRKGGGVPDLTGGARSLEDNIAASLNEIFFGCHAIAMTLGNWIANYSQVFKAGLFLNKLPPKLVKEAKMIKDNVCSSTAISEVPYLAIGIRSLASLNKLLSSEPYRKRLFATLDPKNGVRMVFMTSEPIKEQMEIEIPESEHISYIDTGDSYDTYRAMLALRASPYNIKRMLNDGGAQFTNQLRDLGLLSAERITMFPWPGPRLIPADLTDKHPETVLGYDGASRIDGCEIEKGVKIFSQRLVANRVKKVEKNSETSTMSSAYFNVYLHRMDENKILL